MSHSVPESKLATSQVAGTRWSSYGTTATLRRSAQFSQHQASSSVLVFSDLFVIRHSRNAIRKPTRAS